MLTISQSYSFTKQVPEKLKDPNFPDDFMCLPKLKIKTAQNLHTSPC